MGRIKHALCVVALALPLAFGTSGCAKQPVVLKPEIEAIRSISKLSTIQAYFHNVAQSTKTAGTGFMHWGEVDRTYWVEYTGIVTYGIEFSKLEVNEENGVYTITIPSAQVQNVKIERDSLTEDSVIYSNDSFWNSNPITDKDQVKALDDAQKQMELDAWQNEMMMHSAQSRAGELISSYISSIAQASGTPYEARIVYADNVIPESIQAQIDKAQSEEDSSSQTE